jgi:hypothetical protein
MRINVTTDLDRFLTGTKDWLMQSPVENNVLLTAIATQQAGRAKGNQPAVYVWAEDRGAVVGAMRWPPPLPATLTAMPPATARALAAAAADRSLALPGVNGPQAAAAEFADRWQELTGHEIGRIRELTIARLDEVKLTEWPPGQLRHANAAEAPVLAGWIAEIFAAAGLPNPEITARQQIDEQLSGDRLYVWEDAGQMVAVTGHSAPVAGVALVHGGFTAPEHRTSWYGAAVVAGVCRHLLDSGCTACIAITDRANRHTDALMRMIGYQPWTDIGAYQFPTAVTASPTPAAATGSGQSRSAAGA